MHPVQTGPSIIIMGAVIRFIIGPNLVIWGQSDLLHFIHLHASRPSNQPELLECY